MSIRRPLFILAAAAALLVGVAGCSSDDDATTTTAAADDATTAPADGSTDDGSTDDDSTDDGSSEAALDCDADRAAGSEASTLSGVTSVLFAADVDSGVSEADITPETTLTMGSDGQLSPSSLEIGVGEVFGVAAPADADISAIEVGCAGGQTLVGGTTIGFVIKEPGTYEIVEDLSSATIGTVTAG